MENKNFTSNFKEISQVVLGMLSDNKEETFKTQFLLRKLDLNVVQLKKIIHYLRVQGQPIISKGGGGYFYTDDKLEVIQMSLSLRLRAERILQAAEGLSVYNKTEINFI